MTLPSLSITAPPPSTFWRVNPFLVFIAAFAGGVFVSSFVAMPPLGAVFIMFLGGAVLLAEKILKRVIAREVAVLALILIAFGAGALRYAVKDFHELQEPTETGVVISEPSAKENATQFVFRADNGERVLVNAPLYTDVSYGDRVSVTGSLKRPGFIEGEEGERGFDYGAYLSKSDIYYTMSFAHVELVSPESGGARGFLYRVKKGFVARARAILPEPYASLLMGLIVAGRDAMPAAIIEEFRRAGVVHIVVLSGYNITVIAEFIRRAVGRLMLLFKLTVRPRLAAGLSLFGIVGFVLMTGAEATVVRAALMAGTVVAASLFGRAYSAPRALFFAGFLMLLENPKVLVFDPSFQLSFLATLGLIYVSPLTLRWFARVTERFELRQTLSQTVATQLTVLPLLVYSVGDVSLVSLPANLLILLIVPFTMLVGFVAVTASFLSTLLALPFTYLSYLLLGWILLVAHTLGTLPFATTKIPGFSAWYLGAIYIGAIGLFTWRRLGNSPRPFSN